MLELPNITAELSGLNIIFVCMIKPVVMTRLPISPQQPRCKRSTSMPKLQGKDMCYIVRLKCDGTCAETRFRLSPKRTSPFKSAGASVQSTAGSRGVRISGSNAG